MPDQDRKPWEVQIFYTYILDLIVFNERAVQWLLPFIITWQRDLYLHIFLNQYYAIWSNIINNNDINWLFLYWSRHKISVSAKGGPIQLMLRVRIPLMARCTTLCDKVCQWLTTGWWYSPGTLVSSTNKTDHHDINDWNIVESGVKHHKANPDQYI